MKKKLNYYIKISVVIAIALALVMSGVTVFAKIQSLSNSTNGPLDADFTMEIENTMGRPGDINHFVSVNGTWSAQFNRFNMKILFDNTKLEATAVDWTDSVVQGDWQKISSFNNHEGYFVMMATRNPSGPTVPPGGGNLVKMVFDILEDAPSCLTYLNFTDSLYPTAYYPYRENWSNPMMPELSNGTITISNDPPNTPNQPDGPTEGEINIEYTYNTSTTDPDDDQVYYKWDFGDEVTDWMGPFDSGEGVSESHIWALPGTYMVKVKAKDVHEAESDWSEPVEVAIVELEPDVVIDSITGGLGVTAVIKNVGDANATDVNWSITIDGGFIILTEEATGVIDTLAPDESAEVNMSVLGIGLGIFTDMPMITVGAECAEGATAEDTVTAKIILIFVMLQ